MNLKFIRKLIHRVTPKGRDVYSLAVPPEIAEALGLKNGGLCHIEIRPKGRGKPDIVLEAYADHPLMVEQFQGWRVHSDNTRGFVTVPLENPATRGPSRALGHEALMATIKATNMALKWVQIEMAPIIRRNRRRRNRYRRMRRAR